MEWGMNSPLSGTHRKRSWTTVSFWFHGGKRYSGNERQQWVFKSKSGMGLRRRVIMWKRYDANIGSSVTQTQSYPLLAFSTVQSR